jgi:hypothetical protein
MTPNIARITLPALVALGLHSAIAAPSTQAQIRGNPCGQAELDAGYNAMQLARDTGNNLHYQTALINYRRAVDACSGYSGMAINAPRQAVVNAENTIWLLEMANESSPQERCDRLFAINGAPMPIGFENAWSDWNCQQFYRR